MLLFEIKDQTKWRHASLNNLSVSYSSFTADAEFSPYPFGLSLDQQQQLEPTGIFGGTIVGNFIGTELSATLNTPSGPQGTNGQLTVGCVETDAPSKSDHCFTWPQFKEWVSSLPLANCPLIFRGHEKAEYRLRTSLHRAGRRDLIRYVQEDLPILNGYVSGVTGRTYRLKDFDDYNNLLSLAQHHGYPTPLLDWTESPYIAAYFALRGTASTDNGNCRIYAFDTAAYRCNVGADEGALEDPHLNLYAIRAASRDHDRALAQQSVLMLSNVAEIEALIVKAEKQTCKRYLTKIDLVKSNARAALDDLRMMGITEASIFPGLDGICRALRDRFFTTAHENA